MVTRETRYIGQLYFGLSTDDPADVAEWHNGDRILLMDEDKMYIYDEAAVTFHEIPMGGGGGGGIPESGSISYHSVTVRWAKVKTGVNTVAHTDEVLPYLMGLAGFSNTNNIATSFSIDPDAATPNNTIGASDKIVYNYNARHVYRYRSGSYSSVAIASNFDAFIPADTFYYIFVIEEVAP